MPHSTSDERTLATRMAASWLGFARASDPNDAAALPTEWISYGTDGHVLNFDQSIIDTTTPVKAQCQFVDQLGAIVVDDDVSVGGMKWRPSRPR